MSAGFPAKPPINPSEKEKNLQTFLVLENREVWLSL
jgi:hypothetical protein